MKVTLTFEFDETLAKQHNFDAEYFVNSIQDYLQADFGDMMDWHNNDPDINWLTSEDLVGEGFELQHFNGVMFPLIIWGEG